MCKLVTRRVPFPCLPKVALVNRSAADAGVVESIIQDCVVADPVYRVITFRDIVERLSRGSESEVLTSAELESSGRTMITVTVNMDLTGLTASAQPFTSLLSTLCPDVSMLLWLW